MCLLHYYLYATVHWIWLKEKQRNLQNKMLKLLRPPPPLHSQQPTVSPQSCNVNKTQQSRKWRRIHMCTGGVTGAHSSCLKSEPFTEHRGEKLNGSEVLGSFVLVFIVCSVLWIYPDTWTNGNNHCQMVAHFLILIELELLWVTSFPLPFQLKNNSKQGKGWSAAMTAVSTYTTSTSPWRVDI